MGLFSQDCKSCGHPLLNDGVTNETNHWMSQGVAITPGGDIYTGPYDGYGTIGSVEYAVGDGNTVWHKACWEVAGSPTEFQGESRHSEDQGYFFEEGAHDLPDPRQNHTGLHQAPLRAPGPFKTITTRAELQQLAKELGVRENWHEPDERDVTAEVAGGQRFDNAFGPGEGQELYVKLRKDGQLVAVVNLATLFAFATGWDGEDF